MSSHFFRVLFSERFFFAQFHRVYSERHWRMLYLYKLTNNRNVTYDTYDSCIVVASSSEDASKMLPFPGNPKDGFYVPFVSQNVGAKEREQYREQMWTLPENVTVQYIGIVDHSLQEETVVCASFNAG